MDQEQQRFITGKPGAKPLNSEDKGLLLVVF